MFCPPCVAQIEPSTSGCESRPGKPPEEPGSQPPASGEILAAKRGETKLQAVTKLNSAASKQNPVRGRAGRARKGLVKAVFRAMDSGAARNRSGVEEMACSEGRTVNWGDPPAPVGEIDSPGSLPWYKATPKSRAVRRESERVVLLMTVETTQLDAREGPVLW